MGFVFSKPQQKDSPAFLSLGMVVLDELHFPKRETIYDVPGGSGAYSTLGARLATSEALSKRVACIILTGHDFPVSVLGQFQNWKLNLAIQQIPGKKSTRGLLKYEDDNFGKKPFRYLTPPLQPLPKDLRGSVLLASAAFHFLARAEDLDAQVSDLLSLRADSEAERRPLIIWEPAPPHCKKANLEAHLRACKNVDVFSPNHLELIALFEDDSASRQFDRSIIETYAQRFLNASMEGDTKEAIVVMRAGEHGCLTLSKLTTCRWFPPYYNPSSPRVVDTTGAGNAFLGAFGITLQSSGCLDEATMQGNVAASFALEQVGLPELSSVNGCDTWNGERFATRLNEYRSKVKEVIP